jgi:hypothetical protein
LSDFEGPSKTGARLNNKTTSQLAATEALLVNPTEEHYDKTKKTLTEPENRKEYEEAQKNMSFDLFLDSQKDILDIVVDQDLTDDEKLSMVAGAGIDRGEATELARDTLKVLAEQAYVADSGNDSEDAMFSRDFLAEAIDQIVDHKREATKALNDYRNQVSGGAVSGLVDSAELFVPFAEWLYMSRIATQVSEDSNAVLLGGLVRESIDEVRSFTLKDRAKITKDLIDLVDQNDVMLFPDGNSVRSLSLLEDMLENDDYSDFEKWFDSITSLFDVAFGAGTLLKATSRSVKQTQALNELARYKGPKPGEFEKAFKQAQEADTSLVFNEEAGDFVRAKGASKITPEAEAAITKLETELAEARATAVKTDVAPAAPARVVVDQNPDIARQMHYEVANAKDDKLAEAFYNASRNEALADDLLPSIEIRSGHIPNKVDQKLPQNPEADTIARITRAEGDTSVTDAELLKFREKVSVNLEKSIAGIHKNTLMVRPIEGQNNLFITMRFSPADNGWRSADRALDEAEFAFQDYGVPRDAFTLYRRDNRTGEWVKSSQDELSALKALRKGFTDKKQKIPASLKEIDYSVGMDYVLPFRPEDLEIDELMTAGGWFSRGLQRISSGLPRVKGQGSLVENFLDPSSVQMPLIANAASVAMDKTVAIEKAFVDLFQDFTDFWKASNKEVKARVNNYIHKANFEGLKFDAAQLKADGFSDKEIDALKTCFEDLA